MTIPVGSSVWRKFVIPGVPSSGPNEPDKAEIIAWATFWEAMLGAGTAGLSYATLGALSADLAHGVNTTATVYADPSAANNGLYVKAGASGTGSWSRIGDLPNAIVRLTVSGGTANAILADAPEVPVMPGNKLYLLTPTANNTGATTINGSPVKNALGSSLAANSLVTDLPVLMAWQTDHYQILVSLPVDATGVLNDVLAAKAAAEAAAAALGNQVHQYDTRAQAAAATIPVGVAAIKITRHATSYPLCYATYIPGSSSGPMAFQEAGGHWWELDVSGNQLLLPWFGASGGGVIDDSAAVQAAISAASGKRLDGMGKVYKITATLNGVDNIEIINGVLGQAGQSAYPILNIAGKTNWQLRKVKFFGDGDPTLDYASTWYAALNFTNAGSTDFTGIAVEDCIFENFAGNYVVNGVISGSGGVRHFCFRRNKFFSKVTAYVDHTHIGLSLYAGGSFANAGGRWFDSDISDNYIDAEGLTIGMSFWTGHTRTKVRGNQIINPGAHSLFNPSVGSHNCYGLDFYDQIGAIGNTDTCATDCEISGNIIQNPPSAGIYIASAQGLNIRGNTIEGQFRTDNGTLPRGAIALNDGRGVVQGNLIRGCWGGIVAANTGGADKTVIRGNEVNGTAVDGFGIRLTPPGLTSTTSVIIVRDNDITQSGASAIGISQGSNVSAKLGPTMVLGNQVHAAYKCVDFASGYFNGTVTFKGNRYSGVMSGGGLMVNSVSATAIIVHDETFETASATGLGLCLDNATNLSVNGVTFSGKGGSSACFQASGGQGCIDGFVFRGVAAALRVSSGSLGYTTPAFAATAGDFVQNLNIDGSEAGSPGAKYIARGWYFQTGTTWVTARQLTGN